MPALTTQQMLDQALEAKHLLAIGNRAASIAYAGRTITYTQTTMDQLDKHIAYLRELIAGANGTVTPAVRNVIRVVQPL